jgi:hypothetical protein
MSHKRIATTVTQDSFNTYKEEYAELLLINKGPESLEGTNWATGKCTDIRETLVSTRNSENFTEYIKKMLEL